MKILPSRIDSLLRNKKRKSQIKKESTQAHPMTISRYPATRSFQDLTSQSIDEYGASILSSPIRPKTNEPTFVSQWIIELFPNPEVHVNPEHLLKKDEVHESFKAKVLSMEEEAMHYLRDHPLSCFDATLLQTHYLVSKNAYSHITSNEETDPKEYCSTLDHPTSMMTEVPFQADFELTLGDNNYICDDATKQAHFNLYEAGIRGESAFVKHFNDHITSRIELVNVAIYRCEILYYQIYVDHQRRHQIRASQVPSAREGLIAFLSCKDPRIKSHALKRLIDVLQADPITKDSYMNLPEHMNALIGQIQLSSSQNLDENTLGKLIEAYALTVTNMWLHGERDGSASIIEDSLKHDIWAHAEKSDRQNIKKSPIIKFWIDFSVQAATRLKTEISKTEELINRACHIGRAVVTIASIIGNSVAKEQIDLSQPQIDDIVENLTAAFYHIENRENWFEPLLAFKYMCHFVRYCPSSTSQLVEMALRYKTTEQDLNLFLGIVSSLESLLLHTTNPETSEACLKTLMTLIFFDNFLIQERIVRALLNMKDTARETLSIASESLLHLIYQSRNDLRSIFPSDFFLSKTTLPERFKSLMQPGQTLCMHVMALFIRFTVDIKTETGVSSESLLGQLTRSTTGDIDGDGTARVEDMMQALKDILPNPLTPDADGNGILHLCVRRGNGQLISSAMRVFSKSNSSTSYFLDPNALNNDGRTPLMLCVEPGAPTFLEGVEILAKIKGIDPNIKDRFGRTFLHYLVESASSAEVSHVLSNVSWNCTLLIDERDATGLTPFMLCMKKDTPESLDIARVLLKAGVNIHLPDPCNITGLEMVIRCNSLQLIHSIQKKHLINHHSEYTCFMMAAEAGKDETLDYLFKTLPNHQFKRAEVLSIMKGALSYCTGCGSEDKMLAVVHKHMTEHAEFKSSCQQALPEFLWLFDEATGTVSFKFQNQSITTEEIQKAVLGQSLSEAAARLFGMNQVMVKCLREAHSTSEDLVQEIQNNPGSLLSTNILGRNALQIAILENDSEITQVLLQYERQNFDNTDHQGNTPLHYAAAVLDSEAYRTILSRVGHKNGMPQNHLGLAPFILMLQLPIKMLPDPISETNPYPHLIQDQTYTPQQHEKFCAILDDTLKWYESKQALNHDPKAPQNPYNYKSRFGWNFLHYAAVYGTPEQAQEIAFRLPELVFDTHRPGGRLPIQQALSRERLDVVASMIQGWIDQAKVNGDSKALVTLSEKIASYGLSLWAILAELGKVALMKELQQHLQFDFGAKSITNTFRFGLGKDVRQFCIGSHPLAVGIQTAIRKNNLEMLSYLAQCAPRALLDLQDDTNTTPLMLACRFRHQDCIQKLLQLAKDNDQLDDYLQTCNISGQAAIHILCCTPRIRALENIIARQNVTLVEAQDILDEELKSCFAYLLDAGANLFQRDDGGNTALHLICGHNHASLIDLICDRLTNKDCLFRLFNALNDDKRSPVFSAVANACMEVFRKLTSIKALIDIVKLDIKDINGFTLLHISAQEGQEGQLEIFQKLIEMGANLCATDSKGETVIHKAAFNRRLSILLYLIKLAKKSPMQKDLMRCDLSQMNPLHKAALLPPDLYRRSLRRYYEQLMMTGSLGASPGSMLMNQTPTPSQLASSTPGVLTSQALAAGTRLSCSIQALDHSFSQSRNLFDQQQVELITSVMIELLDWGIDMETEDQQGYSVWHYLMRGPYGEVLEAILNYYKTRRRSFDFSSIKSHKLETVLHLAAKFGQLPQLQSLVAHMSPRSLNLKTKDGFTAISLALLNDHFPCVRYLTDAGCRLDQTTRAPIASKNTPKGDNLLHQIAKKTTLNEFLTGFFKEISKKAPSLLTELNSENQTVLEELTIRGHLSLLPLTITRMPKNEFSNEAIRRAVSLTHLRISTRSSSSYPSQYNSQFEERMKNIQMILSYGDVNSHLGKALTIWPTPKKVRSNVAIPTVEELCETAQKV